MDHDQANDASAATAETALLQGSAPDSVPGRELKGRALLETGFSIFILLKHLTDFHESLAVYTTPGQASAIGMWAAVVDD